MATVEQYLSVLAGAQSALNAEAHRAAAQMQIEVRAGTNHNKRVPPPHLFLPQNPAAAGVICFPPFVHNPISRCTSPETPSLGEVEEGGDVWGGIHMAKYIARRRVRPSRPKPPPRRLSI
jgi:hypothetical protein